MKNKLKIILVTLATLSSITLGLTSTTYADTNVCELENVAQSVRDAAGCNDGGNVKSLPDVVLIILNIVIGLVGFIAVIFIIIGGISYMTSSGESAKVEKAKKTILYAVIGLVICILASAIVNFTIAAINNAQS